MTHDPDRNDRRQAETLQETLKHTLSDLRMEIAGTDKLEFRTHLKERKAQLDAVRLRLAAETTH